MNYEKIVPIVAFVAVMGLFAWSGLFSFEDQVEVNDEVHQVSDVQDGKGERSPRIIEGEQLWSSVMSYVVTDNAILPEHTLAGDFKLAKVSLLDELLKPEVREAMLELYPKSNAVLGIYSTDYVNKLKEVVENALSDSGDAYVSSLQNLEGGVDVVTLSFDDSDTYVAVIHDGKVDLYEDLTLFDASVTGGEVTFCSARLNGHYVEWSCYLGGTPEGGLSESVHGIWSLPLFEGGEMSVREETHVGSYQLNLGDVTLFIAEIALLKITAALMNY